MKQILSLDHPFGNAIPISLDTSNFIALGKEQVPSWYQTFRAMKESGQFTFCLSDLCIAEILNVVHNTGFDQLGFIRAISRLRNIIDAVFPILPGGTEMELLCKVEVPNDNSPERPLHEIQTSSLALWEQIAGPYPPQGIIDDATVQQIRTSFDEIRKRYVRTFESPESTAQELKLDLNTLSNDAKAKQHFFDAFRNKFSI